MPKRLPFFLLLLLQSASIIMPSFGTKLIFAEQLIDFSHLSSDFNNLEPPNCGNLQTASLILDIDLDGINDFVIAENSQAPSVVWYQRNPAGWKKHIIDNTQLYIEAGGAFCDIDNDLDLSLIHI